MDEWMIIHTWGSREEYEKWLTEGIKNMTPFQLKINEHVPLADRNIWFGRCPFCVEVRGNTFYVCKRSCGSTLRDAMKIGPPVVQQEGRQGDGIGVGI